MKVEHRQNETGGLFYITENGIKVGEMEYNLKDDQSMVIIHTEVDEAYRGRKFGEALVETGVEYASSNQIKVVPLCTYAKAIINRNDEMKDVF